MKYSLYCKLFGHKFMIKSWENEDYFYRVFKENCINCGISKKELGIKSN